MNGGIGIHSLWPVRYVPSQRAAIVSSVWGQIWSNCSCGGPPREIVVVVGLISCRDMRAAVCGSVYSISPMKRRWGLFRNGWRWLVCGPENRQCQSRKKWIEATLAACVLQRRFLRQWLLCPKELSQEWFESCPIPSPWLRHLQQMSISRRRPHRLLPVFPQRCTL
jgi:hypothetical protein